SIYNSLSSTLRQCSIVKFDSYFKQLSKNQIPEYSLPENIEKIDINIPSEGLFSEYFYIYKGRGNFKYIPDTLKNEKILSEVYIDDLLIPTSDTIRNLTVLDMHIQNDLPILFIGPTGSGKTLCIKHYLNHMIDNSKYSSMFLRFIPRLDSNKLQAIIHSNLLKHMSFHGEQTRRKNLVIIEDINVVATDGYNISQVIEFLRQILEQEFWIDPTSFVKKEIEHLGFIATIGSEEGFKKKISKRLLKHFNIFRTNSLCEDDMLRIYSNVLLVAWKQNGFSSDIAVMTNILTTAFLNVYKFCLTNFKSSPLKFSYCYNIWDFMKVLRGLFVLKKESSDANKKIHSKIWMHECLRVFGDRVCGDDEKEILLDKIVEIYEHNFKESFADTFNGFKREEIGTHIIFGVNSNERYEELDRQSSIDNLQEILKKNYANHRIKTVLFEQFLTQFFKISRLLNVENTNGLLIGTSGTGRKT
ncbi:hypothetical protein HHI36_022697, partial [Cryptolaemus montrouzieri]